MEKVRRECGKQNSRAEWRDDCQPLRLDRINCAPSFLFLDLHFL
jgi:hypothetical protein